MPVCKNEKDEHYFNAAYLSDDDFAAARKSWRRALCGDQETNDLSDPIIRQMLGVIDAGAEGAQKSMNRWENIPILFGDKPPVESEELCTQYGPILSMATAWGAYGCKHYHDPDLLKDIIYALDWMEANMYGAEVLSDTSFRSYLVFNWWHWYIGGAVPMLFAVMIIETELTRAQIDKYVLPMHFLRTQMRLGNNAEMAVGQIMPCTPLALLSNDRALLQSMYLAMGKLLELHEEGDNMRADWCCMTHGMPYNLGYGQSNLDRLAYILQILAPTPLNFPLKDKYNLMKMARYCFAPSLYRGHGLHMMSGRSVQTQPDEWNAARLCGNLRYLIGVFGPEEDQELYDVIARNATPFTKQFLLGYDPDALQPGEEPKMAAMPYAGLCDYKRMKQILLGATVQKPYELGYMWRSGDCCVQHHNDVCLALRMNSERVFGYECINHENMDGWYTGDGHLYVYLPGQDEHYSMKYWKNMDKYHVPGVTADTQVREVKSIVDCFAYRCDRAFTGGVALDNLYLTAAMDFRSFHNDKVFVEEDIGYGSGMPLHDCTLEGRKAWFFFDKTVVALGAGITAHDGFDVHTTVENRMLTGDETFWLDGEQLSASDFEQTYPTAKWLCIDGVCGFVFPQGANLTVRRKTCDSGEIFLTAWINHGVNPTNAGYVYALLPLSSAQQTKAYAANPGFTVLSDTAELLAAKEDATGLGGYAFFAPGTCGDVRADTPLILMKNDAAKTLSVCDPTQKQASITYSIAGGEPVTIDVKDTYGKAFTADLQ